VAGGLSGAKLERFTKGSATGTALENPYLVIGDCDKAVLFKATAISIPENETSTGSITVDGNFGALSTPVGSTPVVFGRGTQIWGINVKESEFDDDGAATYVGAGEVFERKDSGRKDLMGNPIYSLYYNGEELVEGVEDFRICVAEAKKGGVGVNAAGAPEEKESLGELKNIAAAGAGDLSNAKVVQVEIDLVLGSIRPRVLPENTTPNFSLCGDNGAQWVPPGASVAPSDRRLRRLFTASVGLRNKTGASVGKEKEK
jgi:hypothetical protein